MSLPRMSLHIGDYLKDTRHLRAPEHGAYLMLIMHYWTTGGIPADDRQLASIACMTDREWLKAKPTIMAFFGDDLRHKRIDIELAEATAKYERRVAAGKKGGQAKAGQCSSNASAGPPAKPKQPITLTDKEERTDAAPTGARPDQSGPEFELYRRGKEVLGSSSGGLIKNLLKAKENKIPLARAAIEMAATKQDAREYIMGCIRGQETQRTGWDPRL